MKRWTWRVGKGPVPSLYKVLTSLTATRSPNVVGAGFEPETVTVMLVRIRAVADQRQTKAHSKLVNQKKNQPHQKEDVGNPVVGVRLGGGAFAGCDCGPAGFGLQAG